MLARMRYVYSLFRQLYFCPVNNLNLFTAFVSDRAFVVELCNCVLRDAIVLIQEAGSKSFPNL